MLVNNNDDLRLHQPSGFSLMFWKYGFIITKNDGYKVIARVNRITGVLQVKMKVFNMYTSWTDAKDAQIENFVEIDYWNIKSIKNKL